MARTRRNRSRGGEIGNNVVPNRIPPPLPISTRPLVRRPLPPPPPKRSKAENLLGVPLNKALDQAARSNFTNLSKKSQAFKLFNGSVIAPQAQINFNKKRNISNLSKKSNAFKMFNRSVITPPPGNMTNADKIEGIKKECNAIREELKRGTKYNETIKKITNNSDTLYPQNVKEYIVNSVRTIYDTVFGNEKSWFSKKNDVPLTIARANKAKNAINELLTTGDCGDACKKLDIGLKSREIPDGYAKAHFRNHYMRGGSRKRNHRNNKTRRHKK